MITYKAQPLLDRRFMLGEGPIFDKRSDTLSWVDIKTGSLFLWNMAAKELQEIQTGQYLSAAIPTMKGNYLLAMTTGIYLLQGKSLVFLCRPPELTDNLRLNDAKCDPAGRFWFGTIRLFNNTAEEGSLFRLDPDKLSVGQPKCRRILAGPKTSNGLAWSMDKKTFYYIDTATKAVDAFDYHPGSGSISNRRQVIKFTEFFPDGMTIDEEDKLWIALWGGGKVVRCDPVTGTVIAEILIPAKNTTSCCFAGENLDTLIITSSGEGFDDPEAGKVFYTCPGVKGSPDFLFDDNGY